MAKLVYIGKFIVTFAAAWAIGASLFILFMPVIGQGMRVRQNFGEPASAGEVFITEQSWYEAQGFGGLLVLIIFAGTYLLGVRLAFGQNYIALVFLSLVAISLSIITGFSIGGIYLPASAGLFLGAMILLSSRLGR